MRKPGPDPYRVLGVSRDATTAEITRAYRRQALAVHPDTAPAGTGAAAQFRAVSDAYQVLSDPARRAAHDRERSCQVPGPGQAAPGRACPGPADGVPPWPWAAADPGLARLPPLWAGPVRVEPLPAGAPGSGSWAEIQGGPADWAGLARWYLSPRRDGL
jgi:DnaJ domain